MRQTSQQENVGSLIALFYIGKGGSRDIHLGG